MIKHDDYEQMIPLDIVAKGRIHEKCSIVYKLQHPNHLHWSLNENGERNVQPLIFFLLEENIMWVVHYPHMDTCHIIVVSLPSSPSHFVLIILNGFHVQMIISWSLDSKSSCIEPHFLCVKTHIQSLLNPFLKMLENTWSLKGLTWNWFRSSASWVGVPPSHVWSIWYLAIFATLGDFNNLFVENFAMQPCFLNFWCNGSCR